MATGDIGPENISFWDAVPPPAGDGNGGGQGPTFLDKISPWDCVLINGKPLPGLCDVKCAPELQIDQQKGPKHDGAKLVLHGFIPGPVDISVTIWTADQWSEWLKFVPLFLRKPNKDDKALRLRS
jgi:hypothetical protein